MANLYVDSNNCAEWQASTAYSQGNRVMAPRTNSNTAHRARVYECTVAGTSGGSQPSWNTTLGATTSDNEVTWTARAPTTWANAHGSLLGLLGSASYVVNGDVVHVDKNHSETIPSDDALSALSCGGDYDDPTVLVCVDKTDSDSLAVGAVVYSQRTNGKTFWNFAVSINIAWKFSGNVTTTGNTGWIFIGDGNMTLLELDGASNHFLNTTSTSHAHVALLNGDIKLNNAANILGVFGELIWKNGSLIAPNGSTYLFGQSTPAGYKSRLVVEDVDLSAMGNNTLLSAGSATQLNATFTRCKLPAAFTLTSALLAAGYLGKVKLHHCSSENRTWEFYEKGQEGQVEASASIYRSGGASDGTTPISWKMTSSAAVMEYLIPLTGPDIKIWNTLASEITLTVHGVLDSATNLQDDELWLEVSYPADAASGLGAVEITRVLPYAGPSNLSASTETWVGTGGFSNENKFKLSATFTPGKAGPITARVCLGKPSTTLYICPKVEIS